MYHEHRPINLTHLRLGMPLQVVYDRDNWQNSETVVFVSGNDKVYLVMSLGKRIFGLPIGGGYELRMIEWVAKQQYPDEICGWPEGNHHAQ